MPKEPKLTKEEKKLAEEAKRKARQAVLKYRDLLAFMEEGGRSNLRLLLEMLDYRTFAIMCLFFMSETPEFRRVLFPTEKQITAARKRQHCWELGDLKEFHDHDITWEEIAKEAGVGTGGEAKKHFEDYLSNVNKELTKTERELEDEESAHKKRIFYWIAWRDWFDETH